MSVNSKNMIWLSEDLINRDLREKFLSAAGAYVSDYHVTFSGGYIFLDASLNIKTIGQLSAKYRLKIMDLTFHQKSHTLYVDYDEDVRPAGGSDAGNAAESGGARRRDLPPEKRFRWRMCRVFGRMQKAAPLIWSS